MRALLLLPLCLILVTPPAECQTGKAVKTPGAALRPASSASHSGGSFLGGTDTCTTPVAIAGQGTFPFDTSTTTTGTEGQNEGRCLSFGTTGIDNDTWFCWTADANGCTTLSTCTLTPGLDTKIAVFPGCGCPLDGTSLACNDDSCTTGSLESTLNWQTTSGTTYTIQVGSFPGAVGGMGIMSFTTVPTACPTPANDDCATPESISGQGTTAFDLTLASTGGEGQNEANCLAFATTNISNDLWYAWTATCTGSALVETCNLTGVDTKLAVYPGSGCPVDGTSLACNDDACGLQSQVIWSATIGATYTIQVGTFPGAATGAGSFDITVTPCVTGGTPICFGDGSGTPCPCLNNGAPGAGCANGTGGGGVLSSAGTPSVTADTFTLTANGVINNNGLFFQGNNTIGGGAGVVFGDGIRCCGGSVVRIQVVNPPGTTSPATAQMTETATTNGPNGTITAGTKKCYQFWYRDPSTSPCGSQFNLTNAVTATWVP